MFATLKTLATLSVYGASIVPRARREIRRWAAAAAAIPDPIFRCHATHSIAVDARNAEAVAALAATAPRCHRRTAVELLVAYQILVDYVDTLGERVFADDLQRGLGLGMALVAALSLPGTCSDVSSVADDGGYLVSLVTTCCNKLALLPSAQVVERQAVAAATRCAYALAHTHTATRHGTVTELREWTSTQAEAIGYRWWEIAAGGNSSIAVLALLAAAGDPAMTCRSARELARAYWPHICVMSTLLDSLVDYERDLRSGEFSFVSFYADEAAVRSGLTQATLRSSEGTEQLRHRHAHAMIVCGVASYYAASSVEGSLASRVTPGLFDVLGRTAAPIAYAVRLTQRAKLAGDSSQREVT